MAEKSTTNKHIKFVDEPMGRKPVTEVPGIGALMAKQLKKDEITLAKDLYAKYLVNPNRFEEYIEDRGGDAKIQKYAYEGMKEWDNLHN